MVLFASWDISQVSSLDSPPLLNAMPSLGQTKETGAGQFSSVRFSRSVVSDSFLPHGLQHARLPCPSSTPRAYSNSCLLIWWCHPTISSSAVPFSFSFQSISASVHFPMSQYFVSVAKNLEFQQQHRSCQWMFRTDIVQNWLVESPCSPKDSQEPSPTPYFRRIDSLVLSYL